MSGFFSLSETALFSLNRLQVSRLRRNHSTSGSLIFSLLEGSRRTLTAILIGNNLVNVIAATFVTTWVLSVWGEGAVWPAIFGFTAVLIIFGEIVPKIFAVQRAEQLAPIITWPLDFFARFLFPVRRLLRWVTDPILRSFLKRMVTQEDVADQEELRAIVSIGAREGVIDEHRGEMIDNIFEFGQRLVKEIMTPRTDLVACPVRASREELINLMRQSRRSHILIYRDRMDQMIGTVSTRQFLLGKVKDFRKLVKPLHFIPETKKIDDLLKEFETKGLELAVAVDEYGGTAGLVTREDILEEVVGNLYDEFESPQEIIEKLADGRYRISGNVPVRQVNEDLGTDFPLNEDVETLAGLFLSLHGDIPREGIEIQAGLHRLKAERMIGRRIASLVLTLGMRP